jgi:hypothetical protein
MGLNRFTEDAMDEVREPGFYWLTTFPMGEGPGELRTSPPEPEIGYWDGSVWTFCGAEAIGYSFTDEECKAHVLSEKLQPPAKS